MNSLKIVFFLPIVLVGFAAALHATAYLHGEARRHLPRFWLFYLATIAAMIGVVFAPGMLTFLLAWEAMGLASAGLVAFENTEKQVRKATWIYLLACHAGACALMLAGVLLTDSNAFLIAFFCAVIGFGLKIGFPPFHVWLPEAHPAAPAPASAVMSGAMIPLGFYGLYRFFSPACTVVPYNTICGWTILALGIIGALGGILFALPQVNLKKLLAFSSVENMGVIAMGLGLGFLAGVVALSNPYGEITLLACAGAFVHVLNHALLKGALFLGAGSILRQTGTLDQDQFGGLMKRMPFTGTLFTVNALGLAGLPPLNGFLGELLIYMAAFKAVQSGCPTLIAAGFLVLIALSLTGGFAAAAYCKAIGATFLGEPRSEAAAKTVETPKRMWIAQLFLLLLSVAMVPGSIWVANLLGAESASETMTTAAMIGGALVMLTAGLVLLRRCLCPRGTIRTECPTWDCGYHAPTARMAYTGTAFTQPIVDLFSFLLKSRKHLIPFKGHPAAPTDAALATETDDRALAGFWRPIFTLAARIFQRAHLLQSGSLHLYILLILITVVILLIAAFAS